MATVKKPAARARAKLVPTPPPKAPPGLAIDKVAKIKGEGDDAPAVGVDPRSETPETNEGNTDVSGGGYIDTAGAVHAAPPTPTREHAATANDEPGAGDSGGHTPRPRRALDAEGDMVEVHVPRNFRLTDAKGEHEYTQATKTMPRAHAEHWYAEKFGVKVKK